MGGIRSSVFFCCFSDTYGGRVHDYTLSLTRANKKTPLAQIAPAALLHTTVGEKVGIQGRQRSAKTRKDT